MPHLIKACDLDAKVRKPYLSAYRDQLRKALLDPSLSASQKEGIRVKLKNLGKPKDYQEAANLKSTSRETLLRAINKKPEVSILEGMKKQNLYDLAVNEGLKVHSRMSKAKLITAILTNKKG